MPIVAHAGHSETASPMFLQHVSPCSCERYTNVIKLDIVKESYTGIVYKAKAKKNTTHVSQQIGRVQKIIYGP